MAARTPSLSPGGWEILASEGHWRGRRRHAAVCRGHLPGDRADRAAEGRITLGHATVTLARAPKSRAAYDALGRAGQAAADHPTAEPPLHLRNAPTKLMKELEYGKDYQWQAGFEHPEGFLPPELQGEHFWRPDERPKP